MTISDAIEGAAVPEPDDGLSSCQGSRITRMEFIAAERASMLALESKLSADRAPHLKYKLREALNLLDEFDKTGSEILLELALRTHQEVVDAIGSRPPEKIEEVPR